MQSSEDDEVYTRPKRARFVNIILCDDMHFNIMACMFDKAREGAAWLHDWARCPSGSATGGCCWKWCFRYRQYQQRVMALRVSSITCISSMRAEKAEHDINCVEGSYIIGSQYPIPRVGKLCWDATYYPHQIGRYLNHAQHPNAELTSPVFARKKWRIGFMATRDIGVGEEVVWDYIERREVWSGCRLVKGTVRQKGEKQTSSDHRTMLSSK